MKPSLIFLAVLFFAFASGETRAQEVNISVSEVPAESRPRRVPTMTINEASLPVILPAKPETPEVKIPKSAVGKGKSKKIAGKATARVATQPAAPADPAAPPPVVLGDARQDSEYAVHEMGTTGNAKYDEIIRSASARHGVDPNLIIAVMRQESGFKAHAVSYKGATGLMQLMPATARRFGVTNIYDPAQNIEGGTRYMRFLLDKFNGDVKLALAGYNAGEGAVVNYGYTIPPYRETRNYVKSISARYGASRHRGLGKIAAEIVAKAPEVMRLDGGSSNRLSNNY
jgi:hypothetical protein